MNRRQAEIEFAAIVADLEDKAITRGEAIRQALELERRAKRSWYWRRIGKGALITASILTLGIPFGSDDF